jgi:cyclopropane fatty-acyl-phospholipid synthase-like methyltransferase
MIRTAQYWENRYAQGGHSGLGSYGDMATFKAETINKFVQDYNIESVLDLGCGDGNQISMFQIPYYVGVDISDTSVGMCRSKFSHNDNMEFFSYDKIDKLGKYDLTLSLDVIFHLLEDETYNKYMKDLFGHSKKYVIIYASNKDTPTDGYMRQHKFSDWMRTNARGWKLLKKVKNRYPYNSFTGEGSISNFYIYKKDAI